MISGPREAVPGEQLDMDVRVVLSATLVVCDILDPRCGLGSFRAHRVGFKWTCGVEVHIIARIATEWGTDHALLSV